MEVDQVSMSKMNTKIAAMNYVLVALLLVLGAVVTYLSRNDGFSAAVVLFLCMFYIVLPATCLLTARSVKRQVSWWTSGSALTLNLIVCLFGALFTVAALAIGQANVGLVVVFAPFAINAWTLFSGRNTQAAV